jgi:SpoVK/Ycf46/Vps4 family AAA+-type ATPase
MNNTPDTHLDPAAVQAVAKVLAAGYPAVLVETWEEERLEALLRAAAAQTRSGQVTPVWVWTAAAGFRNGPGSEQDLRDPASALAFVATEGGEAISLMLDLPALFNGNMPLQRSVRDAYDALADQPGALVMTHPLAALPPELGKEVFLLRLPLPGQEELASILLNLNSALPPTQQFDPQWLDASTQAMVGISSNEARDLFKRLASEGTRDVAEATRLVRAEKAQMLMKENCLEVIETRLDLDQIGGLTSLKNWIKSRHRLFGPEAKKAGIEPPSGILLMGVSGCGKSLAAKIIPTAWRLPLIRMDMNLVMSGAWGSPETAWERALRTTESAAPVVLWIDEIENSFGYSNGAVASGNMTIFSSFLTWMQEKPDDVFVVATANKIEMLPAEMLRKGRFDQLFFLDLPKKEARIEILRIHIHNQAGDPEQFDLAHLADLVDGWTAAEIEQMVRAARLDAFYEERSFEYDDLMKNSFRMVPLSKTMAEQINELRRWSHKRAIPAD